MRYFNASNTSFYLHNLLDEIRPESHGIGMTSSSTFYENAWGDVNVQADTSVFSFIDLPDRISYDTYCSTKCQIARYVC